MNVVEYDDARLFRDAALTHLLQREAENNLMIGIALRLADGTGKWGDEPPLLLAIEDGGEVVAAALRTPPYNLQLTRMDGAALDALIGYLRRSDHMLPGVLGPQETATAFADRWTAESAFETQHDKGLGVYQLRQVIPPANVSGHTEPVAQADKEMLVEWVTDFNRLVGSHFENAEETVVGALRNGRYWLWNDPHPVSLAASCGPTPNGMRVSCVYTPPECRGHGYASANVATLSQHLLDSGREFCYLFTDLANPTSNSIYRKIGYEQVCQFASLSFEPKPVTAAQESVTSSPSIRASAE